VALPIVPIQFLPIDGSLSKHMNHVTPRQEKMMIFGWQSTSSGLPGFTAEFHGLIQAAFGRYGGDDSSLTVRNGSQFSYVGR